MEVHGDIFFVETPAGEAEQKMIAARGRQPWNTASSSMEGSDDTTDGFENVRLSVSAGGAIRLNAYLQERDQRQGQDGAYLFDIQHWPGKMNCGGGPLWPCMLTHGEIVSAKFKRRAVGKEHWFAQGWHVYPTGAPFKSVMTEFVDSLTGHQAKKLAGNGWALPAMAAWTCYVLANSVKREEAQPARRMLREPLMKGGSCLWVEDAEEEDLE